MKKTAVVTEGMSDKEVLVAADHADEMVVEGGEDLQIRVVSLLRAEEAPTTRIDRQYDCGSADYSHPNQQAHQEMMRAREEAEQSRKEDTPREARQAAAAVEGMPKSFWSGHSRRIFVVEAALVATLGLISNEAASLLWHHFENAPQSNGQSIYNSFVEDFQSWPQVAALGMVLVFLLIVLALLTGNKVEVSWKVTSQSGGRMVLEKQIEKSPKLPKPRKPRKTSA